MNVGGNTVITGIAVAGGKVVLTSVGFNAGDTEIEDTSVGTFKQFLLTNTTVAEVEDVYPIGSDVAVGDALHIITIKGITTVSYTQNGNDVLVLLSGTSGYTLNGTFMWNAPLALSYNGTPGNGNPLPGDLATVDNYDESTFPLWVGQAVIVTAQQDVTNMSTTISKIDYNGGKARLTFNPPVTASGAGAVAVLSVIPQKAQSLALSYPERWELIQYRMKGKMDSLAFNNKYRKWVFDADTIPEMPTNGIYEKTFLLDPLTDFVVVCLCETSDLVSNVGELASYRLRIDGVDTTSREILLSGDNTYKFERLMNGFQYLSDDLGAISSELNPLSRDVHTYTILQDLLVDGQAHKLTVSLKNGNSSVYDQRNIRIYKRVITLLQ
jgi:hypothetical protein